MFMNETFMKCRAPRNRIATSMPVVFDNFSTMGETYRRALRSIARLANESKMQSLIWNESDVSTLADKCRRGSMLRCNCPMA